MSRTAVNVTGDLTACVVLNRGTALDPSAKTAPRVESGQEGARVS